MASIELQIALISKRLDMAPGSICPILRSPRYEALPFSAFIVFVDSHPTSAALITFSMISLLHDPCSISFSNCFAAGVPLRSAVSDLDMSKRGQSFALGVPNASEIVGAVFLGALSGPRTFLVAGSSAGGGGTESPTAAPPLRAAPWELYCSACSPRS